MLTFLLLSLGVIVAAVLHEKLKGEPRPHKPWRGFISTPWWVVILRSALLLAVGVFTMFVAVVMFVVVTAIHAAAL